MILDNIQIVGEEGVKAITIGNGNITDICPTGKISKGTSLQFDRAIAFPGLINSHDHLDFNCFPMLGNRVYNNYVEWGNDIHAQNKAEIQQVLSIPKRLRIQWGVYKNLLNGITTVANHGPILKVDADLITVFQYCTSPHSVAFEKNWKLLLNVPRKPDRPFVIHIGEGTDGLAKAEIDQLLRWNILRKRLIGIHGVAMSPRQASRFAALVWSPCSNLFLLNKTADINSLKKHTKIVFGTDSTLTAPWSLWEQLRTAKNTGQADEQEIYAMLTRTPATVWQQLNDRGKLAPGMRADIVVAKMNPHCDHFKAFLDLNPEDILLVMHKGEIRLFDHSLCDQIEPLTATDFHEIVVNGVKKFVKGNLPAIMREIRRYHPGIEFPINAELRC